MPCVSGRTSRAPAKSGWVVHYEAVTIRDEKRILPTATKESLKALPDFKYANDLVRRAAGAAAAVYFSSSNSSSRLRWSGLKLSSEISHSSVSPRGPLVAAIPSRLSTATGEASRASSRARIVPPG